MKKLVLISLMSGAILFAQAQKSNTSTTNKDVKSNTATTAQNNRTPIQAKDLQKAISENIKKDYPDYKVLDAYKINDKDVTTYEVMVEKAGYKENLYYDKDGKFLLKKNVDNPKDNSSKMSTTGKSNMNKKTMTPKKQ
jgi:hypothetical protein